MKGFSKTLSFKNIFPGTLFWFIFLAGYLFPQAGTLDNSFDIDGIVTTAIGSSHSKANAMAIQSDGKIVAAGFYNNGDRTDFALARYNPNGTLDNTFGTAGIVTTFVGSENDVINDIVIQPDGKIIAVGNAYLGSISQLALARYNSDGSLDNTFGTAGIFVISLLEGCIANSADIDSDGKIVTAGQLITSITTPFGNLEFFLVARFNANGTPDMTFGTAGFTFGSIVPGIANAYAVKVLDDNKILAGGFSYDGVHKVFTLAKYNTNGELDDTFDDDALATSFSGFYDEIHDIAVLSDGKIIAAGKSYNGSNYDFAIAKYNSDGSLDTTFDSDGKVTTAIGTSDDAINSIAIQDNGKIIAAGESYNGTFDFAVARYNTNGSLDNIFGTGGKTTTSLSGANDYACAVAIQNDKKIVAAGVNNSGVTANFALVRYFGDGTLTLTSPNGSENWVARSVHNITWTSISVNNVKLEYTTNNGSSWITIVNSTPAGAGTYLWTVPQLITPSAKIRISSVSDPSVFDISDAVFTISSGVPGGLNILISDVYSHTGAIVSVPVYLEVNNSAGIPRYLFQGQFHYDTAKLQFRSITNETGTLLQSNGWSLTGWEQTPGTIIFFAFGLNNINTSGLLLNLNMKVIDSAPGAATLSGLTSEWISQGTNHIVNNISTGEVHYSLPSGFSTLRGDATLDYEVSMADVTALVYHLYANVYLSGQGLINADADIDGDVDIFDVNAMLWYISFHRWDNIPDFTSSPSSSLDFQSITFCEDGVVEIPVNLLNADQITAGEIFISYNPEEISFQSFKTVPGNVLAYGGQTEEGKSFYIFTRDLANQEQSAGKILLRFKNGVINPETKIFTQYRLNNGELKTAPDITFGITNTEVEEQIPVKFLTAYNFPNPFNPVTTVEYKIPEASFVTIKIYDMLGREVKTLANDYKTAGTYHISWNGNNNFDEKVGSGTYICRITAGNNMHSIKMLLMK